MQTHTYNDPHANAIADLFEAEADRTGRDPAIRMIRFRLALTRRRDRASDANAVRAARRPPPRPPSPPRRWRCQSIRRAASANNGEADHVA
jgi:hypothetical protein